VNPDALPFLEGMQTFRFIVPAFQRVFFHHLSAKWSRVFVSFVLFLVTSFFTAVCHERGGEKEQRKEGREKAVVKQWREGVHEE